MIKYDYSVIQKGNAFQVDDNTKLRKTAPIDDDIGYIVRIGSMNDTTSYFDIGTLISRDFKKAMIIIRSFKSGDLVAYDMNCTNSNTFHKHNDITLQLKKNDLFDFTILGGNS
tara:strand:- start:564 stop:902 length:339 start_codon:yes stop_codon:yes gene_type:complete